MYRVLNLLQWVLDFLSVQRACIDVLSADPLDAAQLICFSWQVGLLAAALVKADG